MDSVPVSRRNFSNKKANKENAPPAVGGDSVIKRVKTSAPPFQLKSNKKEETLPNTSSLKAKDKQADRKLTSSDTLKKTGQKYVKGAAVTVVTQRQTHSQAFLSEQAVKHRKMVAEAPKPPAAVTSSKPALGTYKGKIVESKIMSIWKSGATVGVAEAKTETQGAGNVAKGRSNSVSDQLGNRTQKPAPTRSKLVSDRPAQVSKAPVMSRPPAAFRSAAAPVRTVPATITSTSIRNTKVAPTKGTGSQLLKPRAPVPNRKVSKPSVSSTISQYRLNMETAEERRAKLADWLASKGKTTKRPAMMTAGASKTKLSAKPKNDLKPQPQSHVEHQPVKQKNPDPEPSQEAQNVDSSAETQRDELPAQIQTVDIITTTLDLLEISGDLTDEPTGRVEDIVMDLFDALEATPSKCSDEVSHQTNVCSDYDGEDKAKDESRKEEQGDEMPQDVGEQLTVEQVKDEGEESEKEETEDVEVETDESLMETKPQTEDTPAVKCSGKTTPQTEEASVVKYSVKTTPYLQSVKKTIEGEVRGSTSRRKSNIKDLKFLTPVRRSCRIERKSSKLLSMLVDHDPCVSSLAELVKLDDDPNAYIYRKNPALLESLPDEPKV